jgi:co-chaperonin GroES (HSP10)
MSVTPLYLVVEKLVDHPELITSQYYINEYQVCKVIETAPESGLEIGEHILVGNKIFFSPADELAPGLFFIYLEEIYGVFRGETISPMKDFVYIETDKDRKHEVGGFFNDTTYNPHAKDNIVQDGTIFSICHTASNTYTDASLVIEADLGDKIYAHHFLTDEDNEREFNGKKYYEIRYENLYCKIVDEEIVMLNEWNFVTPVIQEDEIHDSGVILDFKQKNKLRVGIVNHTCKKLLDRGINIGDQIFFKYGREYEIDVEGNTYYRINTEDIIYKIDQK